jgi:hypothetical protein
MAKKNPNQGQINALVRKLNKLDTKIEGINAERMGVKTAILALGGTVGEALSNGVDPVQGVQSVPASAA